MSHCLSVGFTTEKIASMLIPSSRADYCSRLAKRGLLRLTKEYEDRPAFYLLTRDGYELAQNWAKRPLRHISEARKITRAHFAHEHFIAEIAAYQISQGEIDDVIIPRMVEPFITESYCKYKRFDAILLVHQTPLTEGKVIGVEYENGDWKTGQDLINFVDKLKLSLLNQAVTHVEVYTNGVAKRNYYMREIERRFHPSALERTVVLAKEQLTLE
ncbi:hypothetical protein [Ferriphaselus amnicola]|uniref:hypothetical protein n=1 Tax=Ferriphaselus amnicola TaxID=1188319 RepID=UPI0011AE83F1|nr:hypothetical protein [Ferriphaselus amnicola]